MKNSGVAMKKLVFVLLAGVGLSGCVAYPAYDAPGYYYGPAVSVGVGVGPYYGYRSHYRRW
jgi:hypothetical protein